MTYLLEYQTKEDFKQVMTTIPQLIYSSDLGQTTQMDLDSYIKTSKNIFKQFSIDKKREEIIWKKNPCKMLCL